MSLVGSTVTLIIKDGSGTLEVTGEIVEIYTGIQASYREVLDGESTKNVKTKYSADYYLLQLASNKFKHILCSDLISIV